MYLRNIFCTVLLLATNVDAFAGPDNIDKALADVAPMLMGKLKEQGFKTIGVMPFRLTLPLGKEETAGSLIQTNLASRTERALAYYRDSEVPVDVVFGLLQQARKIDANAEYLSAAGRSRIFGGKYELPIGSMSGPLDGIVTGSVIVSKNWLSTTIYFEYCGVGHPEKVIRSGPYTIATDRNMLIHLGKGFSLSRNTKSSRSIDGGNKSLMEGVTQDETFLLQEDRSLGINDPSQRLGKPIAGDPWKSLPVALTIRYDDQSQSITKDEIGGQNNFSIVDPKPGQRVTFDLQNRLSEKVGVVLAVNGVSLLYNELAADPDASAKFILEPNATCRVQGVYQKDHKGYQPVMGLAAASTASVAASLPAEAVGLIHLCVYRPGGATIVNSGNSGAQDKQNKNIGGGVDYPDKGAKKVGTGENGKPPNTKSGGDDLFAGGGSNDTWLTGFSFGLARSGGVQPVRAKGSFHPSAQNSKASNWESLIEQIGAGVAKENYTSRGLIAPQGNIQTQQVKIDTLGPVQLTDTIIIRYISVARGSNDIFAK